VDFRWDLNERRESTEHWSGLSEFYTDGTHRKSNCRFEKVAITVVCKIFLSISNSNASLHVEGIRQSPFHLFIMGYNIQLSFTLLLTVPTTQICVDGT